MSKMSDLDCDIRAGVHTDGGLTISDCTYHPTCAAMHLGMWMIEPVWMRAAVEAVRTGTWPIRAVDAANDGEEGPFMQVTPDGVAVLDIAGQMQKGFSKFGGTSTLAARKLLREAVRDDSVRAILLHIDSPGGTVAGTADFAADVRAANEKKPVSAHIDDLGASAAYWVASQAGRITANTTAEVGSIGTVAVVEDSSGKAETEGIKVHVVSTGEFKGAFADGAPVEEKHLEELQARVNELNAHFLHGVAKGRGMSTTDVKSLADGRVHIAAKAKALGLIDGVMSFDAALVQVTREGRRASEKKSARARSLKTVVDFQIQGR